jgi:hypothetical protein
VLQILQNMIFSFFGTKMETRGVATKITVILHAPVGCYICLGYSLGRFFFKYLGTHVQKYLGTHVHVYYAQVNCLNPNGIDISKN